MTRNPQAAPPPPRGRGGGGAHPERGIQTLTSAQAARRLRYYNRDPGTHVLGPGLRAVLWMQGCPRRCPGCLVPESWPAEGGLTATVEEMAEWVLSCPDIEGLTLSGGEPMLQAEAAVALIDLLRQRRDLGLMVYTGFLLEELQAHGTAAQKTLLDRLDLLVDGPYLQEQHADLLWRGSSNQRLLALSGRYRGLLPPAGSAADRNAGMEFRVEDSGVFHFTGVPSKPGFRAHMEAELAARGVRLARPG